MRKNMLEEVPILFENKEECCGCAACYSICPVSAIVMQIDEMGFEYPNIDEKKCIHFLKFVNTCPISN